MNVIMSMTGHDTMDLVLHYAGAKLNDVLREAERLHAA